MEILSFILGIAFVVVIAMSIVAVYAFVKVNKLRKELDEMQRDICQNIEEVYRQMYQRNDDINRMMAVRLDELYSRMNESDNNIISMVDSRYDKLENKLITKK